MAGGPPHHSAMVTASLGRAMLRFSAQARSGDWAAANGIRAWAYHCDDWLGTVLVA
jgi:hypothetical protein